MEEVKKKTGVRICLWYCLSPGATIVEECPILRFFSLVKNGYLNLVKLKIQGLSLVVQ